jgi:hypothetical protein
LQLLPALETSGKASRSSPVHATELKTGNARTTLTWLLRVTCAVMFTGHGWMCWNGQMQLHALLQNEPLMAGIVEKLFSMDWKDWVSLQVSDHIDTAIRIQAWIFFFFATATLVPVRNWIFRFVYLLGAINLVFLAWLKYFDAGTGMGHFFEHSSQFCLPLILYLIVFGKGWSCTAIMTAGIAMALTFTGHGLFAIGLPSEIPWLNHPRPGNFTEMTMLCLGLESEVVAGRILLIAGILDLTAVLMLFSPGRLRVAALSYMVIWGLLTTLARPWSHFDPAFAAEVINRWLPEAIYRVPHFGLPFCLMLALPRRRMKD